MKRSERQEREREAQNVPEEGDYLALQQEGGVRSAAALAPDTPQSSKRVTFSARQSLSVPMQHH
jgi:hypothetical protein